MTNNERGLMMSSEYKKGIFLALSAYILWGILPIYWHLIDEIGAFEILAFRIIFFSYIYDFCAYHR